MAIMMASGVPLKRLSTRHFDVLMLIGMANFRRMGNDVVTVTAVADSSD